MAAHITRARSVDVVGSVDDLLIRILLRLPVKSLMRFKAVSRHWKSLITSRHFRLLRYPGPTRAVGLFYPSRKVSTFGYIHLDATTPQSLPLFDKLSFSGDTFFSDYGPASYWIHQSCNGLLLCCSTGLPWGYDWFRPNRGPIRSCYVYNPTTNCFTKLPLPVVDLNGVSRIVLGVNLAFDRDLYKVVCISRAKHDTDLRQIEIYSAESGAWRVSGDPFSSRAFFKHGVYWNGSIHWICYAQCSTQTRQADHLPPPELLYFHVDKERLGKVLLPAELGGNGTIIRYFGESCDHLHIVGCGDEHIAFNVYELKMDYSEWFVKYRVDLTIVATAFPEMAYEWANRICYAFCVFSLIRGIEKENSFLIMQLSGRVVRFNLDCNTFEEISGYSDGLNGPSVPHAFEFIESIASV